MWHQFFCLDLRWMLDSTFFCDTLHKQSILIDFPYIWPIFMMTIFFGPNWRNGKLSILPIWTIKLNFLYVLFRQLSICQRHITSHSPYRSPCNISHLVKYTILRAKFGFEGIFLFVFVGIPKKKILKPKQAKSNCGPWLW